MTGALSTSSAAPSLAASRYAGIGTGDTAEKLPLRGSDCECEAEERKQARETATRALSIPPLDPEAILALQGGDAEEPATLKDDPAAKDGEAEGQDPTNGGEVAAVNGQGESSTRSAGQSEEDEGTNKADGLSEGEEKQVEKLKERDREVRAHEQAHARVGGAHAGPPSYTYQQGPDGKRYAIGGEVAIDTSAERTAEATVRKMQVVIRAATAPAEPSSQDLKVAQQARTQLQEAQAQIRQERVDEQSGGDDGAGSADAAGAAHSGDGPSAGASDSGENGANGNGSYPGGASGSGAGAGEGGSSLASRAYSDALQLFQQASQDRAANRLNELY